MSDSPPPRLDRAAAQPGSLDPDDARRLGVYGRFGALIGNNDMPLGNAGALLADTRPLALAPAYDMLPMALRPAASGEVVERDYTLALPTLAYRDDWRAAATMALEFWECVAQAVAISADLRSLAASVLAQPALAMQRSG